MVAAWQPGHAKFRGNQIGFLGFCRPLPSPWSAGVPPPAQERAGRPRSQGRSRCSGGPRFGACTAGISADICSRCAPSGLPNRHMESTSAVANRRTSMHYWSLRTRCSRPTGCRVAACGGFSPRPARSPWWRERTAPSWESPSCCFVLTAGWHASILSQSPRSIQAAGLHLPCSRWQRRSRGGANADPCGLKFTKEITVPLRFIAGPGIMNSAGTITITRTAVMRSGSRSNCRMTDDGAPEVRHLSSGIRHQKGTSP